MFIDLETQMSIVKQWEPEPLAVADSRELEEEGGWHPGKQRHVRGWWQKRSQ